MEILEREVFESGARAASNEAVAIVVRMQFNAKTSDEKAMRRTPLSHSCRYRASGPVDLTEESLTLIVQYHLSKSDEGLNSSTWVLPILIFIRYYRGPHREISQSAPSLSIVPRVSPSWLDLLPC
jgi:hypothetical protein